MKRPAPVKYGKDRKYRQVLARVHTRSRFVQQPAGRSGRVERLRFKD